MSFSDEYLSYQALNLEGFNLSRGGSRSSGSLMRERGRQILKEKIREEMIAMENMEREKMVREIITREERRIIREEVRRELEMERAAMGAGYHGRSLSSGPMVNAVDRAVPNMRFRRKRGFSRVHRRKAAVFEGEVGLKQDAPHRMLGREVKESCLKLAGTKQKVMKVEPGSTFLQNGDASQQKVGRGSAFLQNGDAPPHIKYSGTKMPMIWKSAAPLHKPSDTKRSGSKRKAACEFGKCNGELVRPWACALCEVTSTSEEALHEHLQGKLHKANVAKLAGGTDALQNKGGCSSKMMDEKNSNSLLRCEVCELSCNSPLMLREHLAGKKHASRLKMQQKRMRMVTPAENVRVPKREPSDGVKTGVPNQEPSDGVKTGVPKQEPSDGVESGVPKQEPSDGVQSGKTEDYTEEGERVIEG